MDKELHESDLGPKPSRAYITLRKSNLPGSKSYTASVLYRSTIDIEAIAERIVEKGSEFCKETFVMAFNTIKEEIYDAIEDGYNVDFGFGRTELTVTGSFERLNQPADRKRHHLSPSLRPSPRLRQQVKRVPLKTQVESRSRNAPHPAYVSLEMAPRTSESTEPYNQLPPGRHPFINIYGGRLTLKGDLPVVGITLRSLETGASYFFPPQKVVINSIQRLGFVSNIDFTPGEWEVVVASQFTPTYHLYKKERCGSFIFTVK